MATRMNINLIINPKYLQIGKENQFITDTPMKTVVLDNVVVDGSITTDFTEVTGCPVNVKVVENPNLCQINSTATSYVTVNNRHGNVIAPSWIDDSVDFGNDEHGDVHDVQTDDERIHINHKTRDSKNSPRSTRCTEIVNLVYGFHQMQIGMRNTIVYRRAGEIE